MHKIILTVLILAIYSVSGCDASQNKIKPNKQQAKTYEVFISDNSFPYVASEERKNKIINAYPKLNIGLTKNEVQTIIGEPDFSQKLYGKKIDEYHGTSWTYYISKPDPNLVNLNKDIGIEVFFDDKGLIHRIAPLNIEALKNRKN